MGNDILSASHGRDRNRRFVITLCPGNGDDTPDLIKLRLARTHRSRAIALEDLWVYLIKCEVNQKVMAKLREKKAAKEAKKKQRQWNTELRRPL